MRVENGRCIRNIVLKQMRAERIRNLIAVFAIALTTLLFTALFTVGMSIVSSYNEYSFRETGGYCHGTFKEVDEEKIERLSAHKKIKEYGLRTVCGVADRGPFSEISAEVSWMDENTAKWSYALPATGRMPQNGREIAMDTAALEKLGVAPQLGAQVELTYREGTDFENAPVRTDVFTLVGFWEYDRLIPVHYINVSEEYVRQVQEDHLASGGELFRTDMNVMLRSSLDIQGTMEQIDRDSGYQWTDRDAENCVRIGVNRGYGLGRSGANADAGEIAAVIVFLLLIMFTGYLIIYNIFQISVGNSIRQFGLLKTIGTTPGQIRRIVRMQSLFLSAVGIPVGCLLGYGTGAAFLPVILRLSSISGAARVSTSPFVFVGASLFSLATVLISCARPGRKAAKITPIEALRYTEGTLNGRKEKRTFGAGIGQMAFANLGRNKGKTLVVVISLSLAVVLFDIVVMCVGSFDAEKYVDSRSVSDFLVGKAEYFRFYGGYENAVLPEDEINEIREKVKASMEGIVYTPGRVTPFGWISEEAIRANSLLGSEMMDAIIRNIPRRGELYGADLQLEGMDAWLLQKLEVYEGELAALTDPSRNAIAVAGNEGNGASPFRAGDTITVTYADKISYIDVRTGEKADDTTPSEFIEKRIVGGRDVEYTVCAIVGIPYGISYRHYSAAGIRAVVSSDALKRDCNGDTGAMIYVFDAADAAAEGQAEDFLASYTAGDPSELLYESKALLREEFHGFSNMFLLVGGVLCFIVGLVGVLNFFNAILTGIMARLREFAMLQSVGMTGKQLLRMLVYEGIFYALSACGISLALALLLNLLGARVLDGMFHFISYRFTLWPVLTMVPVFLSLGMVLPVLVYLVASKHTIVERLREAE